VPAGGKSARAGRPYTEKCDLRRQDSVLSSGRAGLALASPARADDGATEQARQHYEIGTQQYDLGHWDDADPRIREGLRSAARPSFLYNRRRPTAARANQGGADLYKNYLARSHKDSLSAREIEERIKSLQKQIRGRGPASPPRLPLEPTSYNPCAACSPAEGCPAQPRRSATVCAAVFSQAQRALACDHPVSPPAQPTGQASCGCPPKAMSTQRPLCQGQTSLAPARRGLRIAGPWSAVPSEVAPPIVGCPYGVQRQSLSHKSHC